MLVFVGYVASVGSPIVLPGDKEGLLRLSVAQRLGYQVSGKIESYAMVSPRGSILFNIYKRIPVIDGNNTRLVSIDELLRTSRDVEDTCTLLELSSRRIQAGRNTITVPAVISAFEAPGVGPVYMHLSTTPLGFIKGGALLKYSKEYGLGIVVNWQGWPLVEKYASKVLEKPTDVLLQSECTSSGEEGEEGDEWI